MAHVSKNAASRTSVILNNSIVQIDPEAVGQELMKVLIQKSAKFKMDGLAFEYNNQDPIFFRERPIGQERAIKKCPSCHYVF